MKRITFAVALFLAQAAWAGPNSEALHRGLLEYFQSTVAPSATAVEYQLLRDQPTITGIAFPKWYLWVRVLSGHQQLTEGAARVAEISEGRFDVTNFMSRQEISSKSKDVGSVFPAALVPAIMAKAESK